jgi:hypothetical protein
MTTSDIVTIIANIALALSFVVALVFGIAQVRAAARDRRERLTLEALRNFQSREFAELIFYLTNNQLPSTSAELRALPERDQVNFIQFSQQMESLGMLVAEEIIDVDLVDKTLGSFVTTTWEQYKVLFLEMRKSLPDPFLAEYFQWLAELISRRMQEKPRQPFFAPASSSGRPSERWHWTALLKSGSGARPP